MLFTYGCSNSGKSYTVLGSKEKPGLVPRAVGALARARSGLQIAVLELSKEGMCDLQAEHLLASTRASKAAAGGAGAGAKTPGRMTPGARRSASMIKSKTKSKGKGKSKGALRGLIKTSSSARTPKGGAPRTPGQAGGQEPPALYIRDDGTGRSVQVEGLSWRSVSGENAAGELVEAALARRAVEATALNSASSRGHTVVMVRVPREGSTPEELAACDGEGKGEGLLVLVDMAGVERSGRVAGERQAETRFILSSLTSLVNVFRAMRRATQHKAREAARQDRQQKQKQLELEAQATQSVGAMAATLLGAEGDEGEGGEAVGASAAASTVGAGGEEGDGEVPAGLAEDGLTAGRASIYSTRSGVSMGRESIMSAASSRSGASGRVSFTLGRPSLGGSSVVSTRSSIGGASTAGAGAGAGAGRRRRSSSAVVVPFRESILTRLLQPALEGRGGPGSRVVLLMTAYPGGSTFDEQRSAFKQATSARGARVDLRASIGSRVAAALVKNRKRAAKER